MRTKYRLWTAALSVLLLLPLGACAAGVSFDMNGGSILLVNTSEYAAQTAEGYAIHPDALDPVPAGGDQSLVHTIDIPLSALRITSADLQTETAGETLSPGSPAGQPAVTDASGLEVAGAIGSSEDQADADGASGPVNPWWENLFSSNLNVTSSRPNASAGNIILAQPSQSAVADAIDLGDIHIGISTSNFTLSRGTNPIRSEDLTGDAFIAADGSVGVSDALADTLVSVDLELLLTTGRLEIASLPQSILVFLQRGEANTAGEGASSLPAQLTIAGNITFYYNGKVMQHNETGAVLTLENGTALARVFYQDPESGALLSEWVLPGLATAVESGIENAVLVTYDSEGKAQITQRLAGAQDWAVCADCQEILPAGRHTQICAYRSNWAENPVPEHGACPAITHVCTICKQSFPCAESAAHAWCAHCGQRLCSGDGHTAKRVCGHYKCEDGAHHKLDCGHFVCEEGEHGLLPCGQHYKCAADAGDPKHGTQLDCGHFACDGGAHEPLSCDHFACEEGEHTLLPCQTHFACWGEDGPSHSQRLDCGHYACAEGEHGLLPCKQHYECAAVAVDDMRHEKPLDCGHFACDGGEHEPLSCQTHYACAADANDPKHSTQLGCGHFACAGGEHEPLSCQTHYACAADANDPKHSTQLDCGEHYACAADANDSKHSQWLPCEHFVCAGGEHGQLPCGHYACERGDHTLAECRQHYLCDWDSHWYCSMHGQYVCDGTHRLDDFCH